MRNENQCTIRPKALLLCVLLQLHDAATSTSTAIPPVEEAPRCPNSDAVEVNSVATVRKSIDIWSCEQNLIDVRGGALTTLIDAVHESPSFVFKPKPGFDYFEVLYRRGSRSTVFYTQKISGIVPGMYIVRVMFKYLPASSSTPRLVLEVGVVPIVNVNSNGNGDVNQAIDDQVWNSNPHLTKYTCSGPYEPEQQTLSQVIIRVQGLSQWQYIPTKDLCPKEISKNISRSNETSDDSSWNLLEPTRTSINSKFHPNSLNNTGPILLVTTTSTPRQPTPGFPVETEHHSTDYPESTYPQHGTRSPRLNSIVTDDFLDPDILILSDVESEVKGENTEVVRMSTPLISGIVGGLAIILLVIGCCVLFKHLNVRGSYGIHSNTYEPESSLHLRDSHYNGNAAAAMQATAATNATEDNSEPPSKPHPSITINDQQPDHAVGQSVGCPGQDNPYIDISQECSVDTTAS